MCLRVNTLWCELVQDNSRPTIKDMLNWVFEDLKNLAHELEEKLLGIQYEYNGMFLKFSNELICEEIIRKTNGESKIRKTDGNIAKIHISLSSIGTKRIRVFRLPFELDNKEITANLTKYGEILSIQDEYWSDNYAVHKLKYKNGNRIVTCKLTKHIPSFITVNGFRALITYEGQPKTCSYCSSTEHLIAECPNKINRNMSYRNAVTGETANPTIDIGEAEITYLEQASNEMDIVSIEQENRPNPTQKRPHTSTSSENIENTTSGEDVIKIPPRPALKLKKIKTKRPDGMPQGDSEESEDNVTWKIVDPAEIENYAQRRLETLEKVKEYIEHIENPLPIKVNELNDLILKCQIAKNIMTPIKEHTPQLPLLMETIKNIKPYIKGDKRTKLWCTKIIEAIAEHLESQALINNS